MDKSYRGAHSSGGGYYHWNIPVVPVNCQGYKCRFRLEALACNRVSCMRGLRDHQRVVVRGLIWLESNVKDLVSCHESRGQTSASVRGVDGQGTRPNGINTKAGDIYGSQTPRRKSLVVHGAYAHTSPSPTKIPLYWARRW